MKLNFKKLVSVFFVLGTLLLIACVTEEAKSEAKSEEKDSAELLCETENGELINSGDTLDRIGYDDCSCQSNGEISCKGADVYNYYCVYDNAADIYSWAQIKLEENTITVDESLCKDLKVCELPTGEFVNVGEFYMQSCNTCSCRPDGGFRCSLLACEEDKGSLDSINNLKEDKVLDLKYCYEMKPIASTVCEGSNCNIAKEPKYEIWTASQAENLDAVVTDMSKCESSDSKVEYCELPSGGFLKVGESYEPDCNTCSCIEGGYFMCTLMGCEEDYYPKIDPPIEVVDSVVCPAIYDPVCAKTQEGKTLTFGNSCEADAQKAELISKGECK